MRSFKSGTFVVSCLLAISSTNVALAVVTYSTDTTLTSADSPSDRFYTENGAVVDVPTGETVLIQSGERYPTTYTDAGGGGGGTLDVFGTLIFDTGHALGAGDGPVSATDIGTINVHAGAEVHPATLYLGARTTGIINVHGTVITDTGGTNTGGATYDHGIHMWGGLEPEGESIINQFPGSHVELDNVTDNRLNLSASGNGSSAYNMMGGTLIVGDIYSPAGNSAFNYSGGTVIIEGVDRRDVINESWWNGGALAELVGPDTVITVPEPGALMLLAAGGLAMLLRRRSF